MQRDVQVHGRGGLGDGKPIPSFLLCLDPGTGNTIFRSERSSKAKAESFEAYTTPIPFERNGRKEILLAG